MSIKYAGCAQTDVEIRTPPLHSIHRIPNKESVGLRSISCEVRKAWKSGYKVEILWFGKWNYDVCLVYVRILWGNHYLRIRNQVNEIDPLLKIETPLEGVVRRVFFILTIWILAPREATTPSEPPWSAIGARLYGRHKPWRLPRHQ